MEEAFRHIAKVDKTMARLIERVGPYGLKPKAREETFPALVRSIIYQQLSGKAAATIHGRVVALCPAGKGLDPAEYLALEIEALRGAGLSRAKASYLIDLCEKARAGVIPARKYLRKMSDDEIIDSLTAVKGIGVWSVEMLLMFNLGRPDVLPAADFGVRKGFAKVYKKKELPTPRELLSFGERWRPYRSVPSWYLWRALEID